jgi:(2R)-sulfolactate sulfo-lyase subunit alpha
VFQDFVGSNPLNRTASLKARIQDSPLPRGEAQRRRRAFNEAVKNDKEKVRMIQFLVHEKADNVGVATVDIKSGEKAKGIYMDSQKPVQVKALQDIPLGHKIALGKFKKDDSVIKYGHDIGRVVAEIKVGEHVHIHNLKTRRW